MGLEDQGGLGPLTPTSQTRDVGHSADGFAGGLRTVPGLLVNDPEQGQSKGRKSSSKYGGLDAFSPIRPDVQHAVALSECLDLI